MWPFCRFSLFILPTCPVQVQFQFQVLPPRCRWDLCTEQLHQLQRKDSNLRVVGELHRRRGAREFLWGLGHDFWDGCRLWEINSRVWNKTRIDETSIITINICDKAWLPIGLQYVLMFVVLPCALIWAGEQGGCLSLSLFLGMILDLDPR